MALQIEPLTLARLADTIPEWWWDLKNGPSLWDLVMSLAHRGSCASHQREPVMVTFVGRLMHGSEPVKRNTDPIDAKITSLSVSAGRANQSSTSFCFTAEANLWDEERMKWFPLTIVGHYWVDMRQGFFYKYETPTTEKK